MAIGADLGGTARRITTPHNMPFIMAFSKKQATIDPVQRRPRLLVIGHGRHGKDTVCEMLRDYHGYAFISSSKFVGQECIWDDWGHMYYGSADEMYEDRANNRTKWFEMIQAYNTPDQTRTASGMFSKGYDIYCGMRRREELDACNEAALFDGIVWVDRSGHLPPEQQASMELTQDDAHIILSNNGTLRDLWLELDAVVKTTGMIG